jgi:hypothetical protein
MLPSNVRCYRLAIAGLRLLGSGDIGPHPLQQRQDAALIRVIIFELPTFWAGAGISFADGHPSANAWIVGTPGISVMYGTSFAELSARFQDDLEAVSKGFYDKAGRPYGNGN